jgi:putative OPT family oligopeptide transporter
MQIEKHLPGETTPTPFIRPDQSLAEITLKAVILSIIITAILGAANVYLALKLGQTIAASIPAAVISMGALRFFRKHNILENNIVQTAASAGEGVAAAVSFVLPALLMVGYWNYFHYWETMLITMIGGLLGVLFSIPLRRVMLVHSGLRFPEGTAIGNVLKASAAGTAKMKYLIQGGLVGGSIALFQTGFKIFSDSIQYWGAAGKLLFGASLGFSPALLGAGFIVGMQACVALLVGWVIAWFVALPILTYIHGMPAGATFFDMAMAMRSDHIRYIGVGAMLLGGVWTLITLLKPIYLGISTSFLSLKESRAAKQSGAVILRTERDIPINYVIFGTIILAIAAFFAFSHLLHMDAFQMSPTMRYGLSFFAVVFVLVMGFLLASVCAYLSGLVGMTNNPLSGLLMSCVLIASLILLPVFSHAIHDNQEAVKAAVSIVLIITTMVATVITISGENLQDLKAGQMVGATPWKQQVMLIVGVVVGACVVGPILELLYQAYGIGGAFPHPGMDPSQMLAAPQAGLMAAIAQGAFGHSLPLVDISIGVVIAFVAIFVDEHLKKSGRRLPILAIGIGIYLPPDIISCVVLGGLLNYLCKRTLARRSAAIKSDLQAQAVEQAFETGTLVACGLVAGAALMGVILAIPFVLKGSSDALSLVSASFAPIATGLGLLGTIFICVWLYRATCHKNPSRARQ